MPLSDREIALISLGVAAFVGLVNILYTMSKLRIVTEPQVHASLELGPKRTFGARQSEKDPDVEEYYLNIDIQNLSSQTAISDIYYTIKITRRRRFWQFWRRKESYAGGAIKSLDPLQSASAKLEPHGSYIHNLTAFIHSRFYPKVIQSLGDEYSYDGKLTYALISPKHLVLVLTISYIPGVVKAKQLKHRQIHRLLPRRGSQSLYLNIASDKRLIELVPPIKRAVSREVKRWSRGRLLASDKVERYGITIEVLRGWLLLRQS